MIVKLLTEHYLELLSLKEACRGSSESTLVKMSNCWKTHVTAHMVLLYKEQRDSLSTVGLIPLTWNGWNTRE